MLQSIAAVMFWLSAGLVLYVYLGYPLLVFALGRAFSRGVRKSPHTPSVSVLISAYNEAAHIHATIRNKLDLRYPNDRLEIIAISDGSTDGTDQIIQDFRSPQVRYVRQERRQGKTAALNRATLEARGEILVFSDANSHYDPDALAHLVANFADPSVGYATGQLRYGRPVPSAINEGCSLYMRYENALRIAETRLGSIIGVNGGIDAVRRDLYRPMRADELPDFALPLRVVEQGKRVVFDSHALSSEDALHVAHDEYRMRCRVARRAIATLHDYRHLLNPFRFGIYAVQLFSHKVLRYNIWVCLCLMFLSSVLLAPGSAFYANLLAVQLMFYVLAVLGYIVPPSASSRRLLTIPLYFCLTNLASANASWAFLTGRPSASTWEPRKS